MNREQAKKALLEIDPKIDLGAIDWSDVAGEIEDFENDGSAKNPKIREAEERVLAVLRQHRDHLLTEEESLDVWREVFVGQAIRVDGWGKLAGAASIADEAETQFRRRFADYLKAKG